MLHSIGRYFVDGDLFMSWRLNLPGFSIIRVVILSMNEFKSMGRGAPQKTLFHGRRFTYGPIPPVPEWFFNFRKLEVLDRFKKKKTKYKKEGTQREKYNRKA